MAKKGRLSSIARELESIPSPPSPAPGRASDLAPNPPIGQRGRFLRVTITIPAELLALLQTEGLRRKAGGETDTSVSALIREAVAKTYGTGS